MDEWECLVPGRPDCPELEFVTAADIYPEDGEALGISPSQIERGHIPDVAVIVKATRPNSEIEYRMVVGDRIQLGYRHYRHDDLQPLLDMLP